MYESAVMIRLPAKDGGASVRVVGVSNSAVGFQGPTALAR
jgi:hypothetical protein